jgi:hypothetical protein
MTVAQPHRALRILLFVISGIEAVAGILLLFAPGWVLSLAAANLALPNSGFVLALLKAIGIIAIALAYLLCAAARDPVRYIAVIDALTFLLLASAALNFYAVAALHIGPFYPAPYLISRAIVQLAIAVVIIALRPKAATSLRSAP